MLDDKQMAAFDNRFMTFDPTRKDPPVAQRGIGDYLDRLFVFHHYC